MPRTKSIIRSELSGAVGWCQMQEWEILGISDVRHILYHFIVIPVKDLEHYYGYSRTNVVKCNKQTEVRIIKLLAQRFSADEPYGGPIMQWFNVSSP